MVDTRLWREADSLFTELLELDGAARGARLAGVDPELRRRVETLLRAGDQQAGILDDGIDWGFATAPLAAEPPASLRGRRLGAYVLDEEIGRGGMAVVYGAHRADGAFEQRVAVKVLGTGLLPTSAAERFRREQELLARLRHPHIATLLDGGVADDGTPFLVMERIDGVAIDRSCDERGLALRDRVELFLQVCDAVSWAHRNLVVHRDIKPGNVLVTEAGDAKLLDFGIAKLLEPAAGDEPTQLRSRLLTPGYAAPEQIDGRPVTTATDVYGLGKVLEKILAAAPVDRDLANIRSRALHAEPERRYADARALGEDLRRWLAGRPVHATPDSLWYRLRKAVARRRAAAFAALLIVAVAVAGLVATLTQAERARRGQRAANAVSDFLVGLFEAGDPSVHRGKEVSVRELLDRGAEQARALRGDPALRVRLLDTLAGVHQSLALHERAVELWREALPLLEPPGNEDDMRLVASIHDRIGTTLLDLDRLDEAESELRRALELRRGRFAANDPAVGESLDHLGVLAFHRGDFPRAAELHQEALVILRQAGDGGRADVASTLHRLGIAQFDLGKYADAEASLREALALHREVHGADHPDIAHDLNALANGLARAGRIDEAEPLQREALALRRRLYAESHPQVAQSLNDLAVMLEQAGRLEPAAVAYGEALASYRALYGPDHQATVIVETNLGRLLLVLERPTEGEALFRAALASLALTAEPNPRQRTIALSGLGEALAAQARWDEAGRTLREAMALARDAVRDVAFESMVSLELGRLALARGRLDEAEARLAFAEAGYRERYGDQHVRTARAAMWLGVCRGRRGDRQGAERLLAAALATQSARLPPAHPHLAATQSELELLASGPSGR